MPTGGKLAGIEKKISELSSGYDTIKVAPAAMNVIRLGVYPCPDGNRRVRLGDRRGRGEGEHSDGVQRLSAVHTTNTIDAMNAGLVTLCADKDVR